MKLLIAVPAYNEEEAIAATVASCLEARAEIIANTPVTVVEISVVSDGSTDGTVAAVRPFTDRVSLIVFPSNRGYGAAIQEAWRRSDAELLGFLDADGTCDPRAFAPLCRALLVEEADIAVGCRIHPSSQMPALRRFGNRVFAALLTFFSGGRVRDTASGMRVVRREVVPRLQPLPDGLHFTPAMTARALIGHNARITEVEIPYEERTGESKLRVLADGLRFLRVILEASFLYRPSRPLALVGGAGLLAALLLMATPVLHYLRERNVAEWMIYRFIVAQFLALAGCLLIASAHLSARIVQLVLRRQVPVGRTTAFVGAILMSRLFWLLPVTLLVAGGALVFSSFVELVETGATYEHWSRFIAMSSCWGVASILGVTKILDYSLDLLQARVKGPPL